MLNKMEAVWEKTPKSRFADCLVNQDQLEILSTELELLMIAYEKSRFKCSNFEEDLVIFECVVRGTEITSGPERDLSNLELATNIYNYLKNNQEFEGSVLCSKLAPPHKDAERLLEVERRLRSKEEVEFEEIESLIKEIGELEKDPALHDNCKYLTSVYNKILTKHSKLLNSTTAEPMFSTEVQDMVSSLKKSHIQFTSIIEKLKHNLKRAEEFQEKIKKMDKSEKKKTFLELKEEYQEINVRINQFEELLQIYEKEEYFINNMDSIIREEMNLRRVFALLNKVATFKLHKTSGVNIILMNKCVETLKKRFSLFKRDAGISKDAEESRAIADFLNASDLQPGVVSQLVKLCKKFKLKAESKDFEWGFKENFIREKNRLAQNYTYFKKFLLREKHTSSKKPEEVKKTSKRNLRPTPSVRRSRERNRRGRDHSSIDGDSVAQHPKDIRQIMFHEIRQVFASTPAYGFSELETVVAAKKLEDKLRMKIKKQQHYESILDRIIRLLKTLKERKFWCICRFLKNMNFRTRILGKLATKSERELYSMEKHFQERKMYHQDIKVVDLENESDIEGLFDETKKRGKAVEQKVNSSRTQHTLAAATRHTKHQSNEDKPHPKATRELSRPKQKKSAFGDLFQDEASKDAIRDIPLKKIKDSHLQEEDSEGDKNQFDKKCEELTREFRKRTERILAGEMKFGGLSDTGSESHSEEEEPTADEIDEKIKSARRIREQENYFKIFQGKFKVHENDEKRKQYMEIYTAFGVEFIKLFTKIKEGTHLSLKFNNQSFKNYIDKILLGPDRERYIVLPAYIKTDKEMAIKSLLTTSGAVASMKYSEKCKIFLYPRELLRAEWLDVINYAVIKTSELQNFNILCFLVCKLDDSLKEEAITPVTCKLEKADQIIIFNKNTSNTETGDVKMTVVEENYDDKLNQAKKTKKKLGSDRARRDRKRDSSGSTNFLGKRGNPMLKKPKLLRLVEEPEAVLKEMHAEKQLDRAKERLSLGVDLLPDSPLLKNPPKNKNESALLSSMQILRGESSHKKYLQDSSKMDLDLDPFSSNFYDDQHDQYGEIADGNMNLEELELDDAEAVLPSKLAPGARPAKLLHRPDDKYYSKEPSNANVSSLFKGFVE